MKHSTLTRLAAYGFRSGIFLLALTASATLAFGSPAAIKSALKESGAYEKASEALAIQAGNSLSTVDSQTVVNEAAKDSFKPESVQTTTEKAIDSTYRWLEGETAKPDISIDLRPYMRGFTDKLGDQATERASMLPVCTAEQLRSIEPGNVDIFNLPCRPPDVDLASAKDQAIARATASNGFLQNPVIDTDSLPKDAEGKTIVDKASSAPQIYAVAMQLPWVFGALALLSAITLAFLMRANWHHTVRKLGRSFVGVGLTLLVIVVLARLFFWYATQPDSYISKLASDEYHGVLIAFVRSLETSYTGWLLIFGSAYAALGILVLVMMRIFWPKRPADDNTPVPTPPSIADSN